MDHMITILVYPGIPKFIHSTNISEHVLCVEQCTDVEVVILIQRSPLEIQQNRTRGEKKLGETKTWWDLSKIERVSKVTEHNHSKGAWYQRRQKESVPREVKGGDMLSWLISLPKLHYLSLILLFWEFLI